MSVFVAVGGASVVVPAAAGHPYPAILANLTSWWSMDEASGTRADSHGTNHLTPVSGPGSAAGKVGNAVDLLNQRLEVASNASLQLNAGDFTLAGWVMLDSKVAQQYLISKGNSQYEYQIDYYHVPDRFRFWSYNAATQNLATANNLGAVSTGVWYFIVAWYNLAGDTWNIQVNNGTPDSAAAVNTQAASTGTLWIGANGASGFTDGLLDEWALWKGYNLSADERGWLWNGGAGRAYAELS